MEEKKLTKFAGEKGEVREFLKEAVSQDLKKQDSGVNVNVKHSLEVSRHIPFKEVRYFFLWFNWDIHCTIPVNGVRCSCVG